MIGRCRVAMSSAFNEVSGRSIRTISVSPWLAKSSGPSMCGNRYGVDLLVGGDHEERLVAVDEIVLRVWLLLSSPPLMMSMTSGIVYVFFSGPTNEKVPVGLLL